MEGEKIKACAYTRVSTKKEEQLVSFDNQNDYFKEFLDNSEDYENCGVYSDRGISGTKLSRNGKKGFNVMLEDAGLDIIDMTETNTDNVPKTFYVVVLSNREPKFKYIFVTNTSRFARNIECMGIINKLIQKGVFIKFLDINKCTENQEDIMPIQLFLVLDEAESRDKSRKIKAGLEKSKNKNKLFVSGKIYGYKYLKSENRLEIIPEEAKIIKEIFQLYSEGNGSRVIVNIINKKGYRTRNNKPFDASSIIKLIKNEKFCGLNNPLKFTSGTIFVDKTNHLRQRDEYETFESDKIPPIVSQELFFKCQEVLNGNRGFYKQSRGIHKGKTEMAGKLKCLHCESSYIRTVDNNHKKNTSSEKTKEPYVWYRCRTRILYGSNATYESVKEHFDKAQEQRSKTFSGGFACSNKNLSQKMVDDEIQRCIDGKLFDIIQDHKKYLFGFVILLINDLLRTYNHNLDAEAKNINDEIIKIDKQLENAYMQLLNKPSEKLEQIVSKLEERLAFLKERSAEVMEDNIKLGDEIAEIFEAFKYAVEHLPTKKVFTREEVLEVVDYWYIWDGEFEHLALKADNWLSEVVKKYELDIYLGYRPLSDEEIKEVLTKLEELYRISPHDVSYTIS